jgi:hypothetical protein
MEILIVGSIIVALMIVASTKIKKSAARAFEKELIDTKDFRLIKPDGFIHPLDEDSEYAFEAYTNELGKNDAEQFRQAQAILKVHSDADFETVCDQARQSADKILSETSSDNPKTRLIETEKTEKDVEIISFWKIVEGIQTREIYELQISVIKAYRQQFTERTNEMLESFIVK